jgi:hypothetical protein
MSRFNVRRRLTYANVMATAAVVIALGGTSTAIAAVIVKSNSQVAGGVIAGHSPPTGKHANIIRGSINGVDVSPSFVSSLRVGCPFGLRAADVCLETTVRSDATFETALQTCASAGRRLPSAAELVLAFEHLGAPQPLEWVASYSFDSNAGQFQANVLGNHPDRTIEIDTLNHHQMFPYRCVTSPTN